MAAAVELQPAQKVPRVAIYQGYPSFHFELIGYAVDYCQTRGYEFKIFGSAGDWLDFYKFRFDLQDDVFVALPPPKDKAEGEANAEGGADAEGEADPDAEVKKVFKIGEWDRVILLTDDDPFYPNTHTEEDAEKVLCIDHYYYIRRTSAVRAHIGPRPFPELVQPWALPCFPLTNAVDKRNVVKAYPKIVVAAIGTSAVPFNISAYQQLFGDMWEHVELHIMARNVWKVEYLDHEPEFMEPFAVEDPAYNGKVFCYQNCHTAIMLKLLWHASYVVQLHECGHRKSAEYVHRVMSGSIPIAFSFGCRLIMPDTWNNHYGFKSALTYAKGACVADQMVELNIDAVIDEGMRLVAERNAVFDAALGL